jgi:hypothetical protein
MQVLYLGGFEGAHVVGRTVQDKSGSLREAKDKRFCVPEGLTSAAMELTVKMKMGEDLAVFRRSRYARGLLCNSSDFQTISLPEDKIGA